MKSTLIICLGLAAIILFTDSSCKKDKTVLINAVITGFDSRGCPCCGGLMITFNGETKPYTGTFFLINNNPADLGISDNQTFPFLVRVDTINNPVKCSANFVNITKLEKR